MQRFGFVTLDHDVADIELQRVHENFCTTDNFCGALTHQHVVATDVGLALDAIENQVGQFAGSRLHEFLCGRECRAAKADDATVQNLRQQDIRFQCGEIRR